MTGASFAVALAVAVLVLPSSLRPPPDEATASAALSPDAPPEESPDAIITSFQQAGSATAGATKARQREGAAPVDGEGPAATAPTTTTTVQRPTRGLCFGDPPRQTESIYSPRCQPAFVGDNGGATTKNVTGDEIRIAFWHSIGNPNKKGPISDEPQPDENAATRTARVLGIYFTKRYETYGRRIRLVATDQPDRTDSGERTAAAKDDDQYRVFMGLHLDFSYCDELVRRGLVCYNQNPFPDKVYADAAPSWWSYQMKSSQNDKISAEYICKRLKDNPAAFAGDNVKGKPRKFALLYESAAKSRREPAELQAELERQCGLKNVAAYVVNDPFADSSAVGSIATAVAQMQRDDVTTITVVTELGASYVAMSAADNLAYYPEWLIFGAYGLDFNILAKAYPPNQAAHTFGMSGWELPRPNAETECFKAYKSIDPNNNPDATMCGNFFGPLEQMVAAIQNAGPNLTPETLRNGFYKYGNNERPEQHAIDGGYAPGDSSFIDKFGEIWWDGSADDPQSDAPGAYRWTNNGARYGVGQIPTGQPNLFADDGITGPTQ